MDIKIYHVSERSKGLTLSNISESSGEMKTKVWHEMKELLMITEKAVFWRMIMESQIR